MLNARRRSAPACCGIWPLAFDSDMTLLDRIRRTIERQALFAPGARILVALSGGADSVAMLFVLRELESTGALTVAGVAHLNHLLRGADANADEAFCGALSRRLSLRFISERLDVAALAKAQRRSVEDAARSARYDFLDRAACELGADVIAVAHTRDDQAETFLLRLLRGAGTRGLGSIRPKAGRVVRPLIDVNRDELTAYLSDQGEAFREDTTNADVLIPRNRVRHQLIPTLRAHFSSGISATLAREAALARQDEEFLHDRAIELARRIVLTDAGPASSRRIQSVTIDAAELHSAPRALSSRVVQGVLERLSGGRAVGYQHVERLLSLAVPEVPDQAISLPGQRAWRSDGLIRLAAGSAAKAPANSFEFSLSIPGEVQLGAQGLAVGAERLPPSARRPATGWVCKGPEVGISAEAVTLPLVVRGRRPGDRFHPLGAPGARKLQDFLVDRKIAREKRDLLPLVVDGRNRIVWVVGQAVGEDFRVTDPSQGVILLKVRHLGGTG
jgi:tRNA(Ile)-lysidine synthase